MAAVPSHPSVCRTTTRTSNLFPHAITKLNKRLRKKKTPNNTTGFKHNAFIMASGTRDASSLKLHADARGVHFPANETRFSVEAALPTCLHTKSELQYILSPGALFTAGNHRRQFP
jgi:hypothetical protein